MTDYDGQNTGPNIDNAVDNANIQLDGVNVNANMISPVSGTETKIQNINVDQINSDSATIEVIKDVDIIEDLVVRKTLQVLQTLGIAGALIGSSADFTGVVDSNGFTVNGVPIGTSSDSFWSAVGDGGISFGDYIDPLSIKDPLATAVDKIVESSASAIDVESNQSSNDSDGGSNRNKNAETSWYNETLNTATRGATKKRPANSIISVLSTKLTIFNGDDSGLPIWMVFEVGTTKMLRGIGKVAFKNGVLVVGSSGEGVNVINFNKDSNKQHITTGYQEFNNKIGGRNSGTRLGLVSSQAIISNAVNDVAITVLPNAPIDETTGLPVETVAVATNTGLSILKDDGTSIDITNSSAGNRYVFKCDFTEDNKLIFTFSGSTGASSLLYVFDEIPSADNVITYNTKTGSVLNAEAYYNTHTGVSGDLPLLSSATNATALIKAISNNAVGNNLGVSWIFQNDITPEEGMVGYTTDKYFSGLLVGDTQFACLASNDDTNLTDTSVVDCTAGTPETGWSATDADTAVYAGSGGLSYLRDVVTGFIAGESYYVSFDITGYTGSDNMGIDTTCGISASARLSANGSHSETFVSNGVNMEIFGRSTNTGTIDNLVVVLADPDRSVNNNGFQVVGTIVKSAVKTGAELMAYSSFSSSGGNWLVQAINSGLDYSTGDFYYTIWEDPLNASGVSAYFQRGTTVNSDELVMYRSSTSIIWRFKNTTSITAPVGSFPTNNFNKIDFVRKDGIASIYVNNVLVASGANVQDVDQAEPLYVGYWKTNPTGNNGRLALARSSATAPTVDQLEFMYEFEKFLFFENAEFSLISNSVTGIDYNLDKGLTFVTTALGTHIFQGFVKVGFVDSSGTPTSNNALAVSASGNSYAIATAAEVVGNIDEINIREQLALIPEVIPPSDGVSDMSNLTAPSNLDADTVTTAELADIVGNLIATLQDRGLVTG